MMNTIITIAREFSSGGRELGRRLAEELGFDYYDKEIIDQIVSRTELSEEYVKSVLESEPHHLMPITTGHSFAYVNGGMMKQEQSVYAAQSAIIKELAEKSSCVIIGRCADYILREYNPYKIFVYSDMASKIQRCRAKGDDAADMPDSKIKRYIRRIDKGRAKYYSFYTGNTWGDKFNYDMCINTTGTDIKKIAPVIAKMFEK